MSTFAVSFQVADLAGRRWRTVEALVDTGASDTVIPTDVLQQVGVQPARKGPYRLADNRVLEYDVGDARLRLDGKEGTVLVVFGEGGGPALLGATTLEIFKLAVDPVGKRLVPVPGLLFSTSSCGRVRSGV